MNEAQDQQASRDGPLQDQDDIFTRLAQYPFDTDPDYLNGLSTILGHPSTPPSPSELSQNADLVLQAKCFYFTRKHGLPAIDPSAYRSWLHSRPSNSTGHAVDVDQPSDIPAAAATDESASTADISTALEAPAGGLGQAPPYPDSFAAIVDLITRNVPVPGIEEIPDTVLEHGSSKVDHTARRKKPWESDAEVAVQASDLDAAPASTTQEDENKINGHLTTGEGVVNILQPDAIPEKNLLAKE